MDALHGADIAACHKFVGWTTATWAVVHGGLELVYIVGTKSLAGRDCTLHSKIRHLLGLKDGFEGALECDCLVPIRLLPGARFQRSSKMFQTAK